MNPNESPPRRKSRTFRNFLVGLAIGVVLGLSTSWLYGGKGYQLQIWTAFWGLIGGVLRLLSGVKYWMRAKQ
jgi:hypothetical protein